MAFRQVTEQLRGGDRCPNKACINELLRQTSQDEQVLTGLVPVKKATGQACVGAGGQCTLQNRSPACQTSQIVISLARGKDRHAMHLENAP